MKSQAKIVLCNKGKQQRQINYRPRSVDETSFCCGADLLIGEAMTSDKVTELHSLRKMWRVRMPSFEIQLLEKNMAPAHTWLRVYHPRMTRSPWLTGRPAQCLTGGKMLSHSSWSPLFGYVNISRWAWGPSVAPLSPEPQERSRSSGVSKHKNAEKLFGRRDELHTSVKGPPTLHACKRSNGAPKEIRFSQ